MKIIMSRLKNSIRQSAPSIGSKSSKRGRSVESSQDESSSVRVQSERLAPESVSEDPRPKPVRRDDHSNAPLENLPPELRRHLLSTLELEELRVLVHASPLYHQQYLVDRKHTLRNCLEATLRSSTVDAHAVHESGLSEFADGRNREKVIQLLDRYRDRRSVSEYVDSSEKMSLDELTDMVSFHLRFVVPLSKYYLSWAFEYIAKQTNKQQIPEPLTRTEETRLIRAFYRFQLCCNLFGVGSHEPPRELNLQFDSV